MFKLTENNMYTGNVRRVIKKPAFCKYENKGIDQLRSAQIIAFIFTT